MFGLIHLFVSVDDRSDFIVVVFGGVVSHERVGLAYGREALLRSALAVPRVLFDR